MISAAIAKIAEVFGVVALHRCTEHVIMDRNTLIRALSHSAIFRTRRIRVSMSQILSIKIGEQYVLIDNLEKPERVTPIGGVVRYFPTAAPILEMEIGFDPERKMGTKRYDLRGFLQGKEFANFLKWYAAGIGREQLGLAREIEEEFNEIGIPQISRYLRRPEFVRRRAVYEGPNEVPKLKHWQFRLFEVCELQEESDTSEALATFIRSKVGHNRHLVLANAEEIAHGKTSDGRLIGSSAGYLFSGKAEGIPPLFEKH
jgi:SMODS-associated NUDIX domain